METLEKIKEFKCNVKLKDDYKCMNCTKRKLCRYCPARFYLETHDYCNPPEFYCNLSNLIMNTFEKKFVFKTFDYNNKIDLDYCSKMHEILKNDYIRKNGIETYNNNFDNDGFEKWVEMLRNDENYNIILCFNDDKLIGFLCYMIIDNDIILCEIQIIPEYQKKYGIFRKLFKELPKFDNISNVKSTIKKDNLHSIECFTNMGMKNTNGLWYEITYIDFKNWLNNK